MLNLIPENNLKQKKTQEKDQLIMPYILMTALRGFSFLLYLYLPAKILTK